MKTSVSFVCRDCGVHAAKWMGRCSSCGSWDALVEQRADAKRAVSVTAATALADVGDEAMTYPSGVGEFDRVLGGGFVAGSTTLLFGEPGVGKSTLALGVLSEMARTNLPVLLVSAEESVSQVARRARRLGEVAPSLRVVATTRVDEVEAHLASRPVLCVVDSISALRDDEVSSGSVAQVRRVAERLCECAKALEVTLVLIGHVTKDGELAGPRTLEHLVDTVIRVEGDRRSTLRMVRALKHRFGPTGEVGLFEMGEGGMSELVDVAGLNRSAALAVPGVVTTVTSDGSRSFLVEIQALVAHPSGPSRRVAHQVSHQRLALMLAVLEARAGIDVGGWDVFATTAAGLSASEPASDAALALAVASAMEGFVVSASDVVVGEVGLAGELRPVEGLARRVREAARLGATRAFVPVHGDLDAIEGCEVVRCRSLREVIDAVQPVKV